MHWTLRKNQILSIGATLLLIATPICAQESMGPEKPAAAVEVEKEDDNYEACAAFRADTDADLGDVRRPGANRLWRRCRLLWTIPLATWP